MMVSATEKLNIKNLSSILKKKENKTFSGLKPNPIEAKAPKKKVQWKNQLLKHPKTGKMTDRDVGKMNATLRRINLEEAQKLKPKVKKQKDFMKKNM